MMNKMIKKFLPLLIILTCTACADYNGVKPQEKELQYKPDFIVLNVKDIEIIDQTDDKFSIVSSYVPPIHPKFAMINWTEHRLRAKGNKGKIEFVIKEASFKETKLKNEEGQTLESLRKGEHNKYDARYLISMKLYSDDTKLNKVSEINIEAFSTRNIEGIISLADKDYIITKMLQELLNNAEQELEYNISYFMGNTGFRN